MEGCRSRSDNRYAKIFNFDNGFGLSVISNIDSYGGNKGDFEVALMKNGEISYTEDFPDIKGWLSFQDVADLIAKVKEYPADLTSVSSGVSFSPEEFS